MSKMILIFHKFSQSNKINKHKNKEKEIKETGNYSRIFKSMHNKYKMVDLAVLITHL